MLIIDNTGFIRKGTTSAGVGRQVHRHVRKDRQPPDRGVRRLRREPRTGPVGPGFVPAQRLDIGPGTLPGGQVPEEREFATKGELAKTLATRSLAARLPADWVTADEVYGQEWKFRRGMRWAIEECFQGPLFSSYERGVEDRSDRSTRSCSSKSWRTL